MADREVTTKYILQGDPSGMVAATDKAKAGVKELAEQGGQHTRNLSGGFDLLSGSVSRFSGLLGGIGVVAVTQQLLEAGQAAERLRNSFAASTGSIVRGGVELDYVRMLSARLGLELQSTSDAYKDLTAASRGTALEGQKTRTIFEAVAGASTALGLSAEKTQGALLAITQMISKGTVQAEELRGQLGERLPGAFQIAARAMGVTTAELDKMLKDGQVISDDFLPKFADELAKTFPPGEKQVNGLTAEVNRLKNSFFDLKTTVMDTGGNSLFSSVIRGTKDATEEVTKFWKALDLAGAKWMLLMSPGSMYAAAKLSGAMAGQQNVDHTGLGLMRPDTFLSDSYVPPAASKPKTDDKEANAALTERNAYIKLYNSIQDKRELNNPLLSNEQRELERLRLEYENHIARFPAYRTELERNYELDLRTLQFKQSLLSVEKERLKVLGENAALEASGNFGVESLKLSAGLSTGDRYGKADTFSLLGDQQSTRAPYSLLGPGPETVEQRDLVGARKAAQYEDLIEENAMLAHWSAEKRLLAKDDLDMTREFLAIQAADRGLATDMELLRIDREQQAWEQHWAMAVDTEAQYEARRLMLTTFFEKQRTNVKRQELQTQLAWARSGFNSMSSLADSFYLLSGKKSKEAFLAYQVTKSGETIISTGSAAMKSYDAMASIPYVGPVLGAIAAAAAVAAGAVQLQSIWSASPDGGGSLSGVSGGGVNAPSMSDATVTQPVREQAPPSQQFTIVLNNPIGERKWFEDNLPQMLQDFRSRNINAGVVYS